MFAARRVSASVLSFVLFAGLCSNGFAQIVQPIDYDHDSAVAEITSLYFFSEPGDFIGRGREWYETAADSPISVNGDGDDFLNFTTGGWGIRFDTANGEPLRVGYYSDATRYPFNDFDRPGLSATGMGRGCNRSGSQFEVFEIEWDGNTVVSFDAEFAQHCENESGVGTPALFGRLRFNATAVPEPTSAAALLLMIGLPMLRRQRS